MPKRCPDCCEPWNRPHMAGCSYISSAEDRDEFVRANAVELVAARDAKIRVQASRLAKLESENRGLRREVERLYAMLLGERGGLTP